MPGPRLHLSLPPPTVTLAIDTELLVEAGRLRGNAEPPTPVTLALLEQTRFCTARWVETLVVELVEYLTGRAYRYTVPPELREYVAGWARGERVGPARFTLVLLPPTAKT